MNMEDARQALAAAAMTAVNTLVPVPLTEWDNRFLVDLSTQQDPFLSFEFVVTSGTQISLGDQRVDRYRGVFAILACVKEGEGLARALVMAETVSKALQARSIGSVVTETSSPQRTRCEKGWFIVPVAIPFQFDDVVTA